MFNNMFKLRHVNFIRHLVFIFWKPPNCSKTRWLQAKIPYILYDLMLLHSAHYPNRPACLLFFNLCIVFGEIYIQFVEFVQN